jgi:hypothetical protein
MKNFNIRAEGDPSGFRARLSSRFKIGNTEIDIVLSTVESAADAYMVFRCGEMSGRSTNDVVEKYKSEKRKGWGVFAKSLGIKPGSKEFKALKHSNDIYDENDKGKSTGKTKSQIPFIQLIRISAMYKD